MSKKIMKKSLALGALMAFVITGSVWAESVTKTTSNERITAGSGVFNDTIYTGINTTSTNIGGVMHVSGKTTFDNCDFIGNTLIHSSNTHGGVMYVSGNGDLTVSNSTIRNNYVESTSNRSYGAVVTNSGAKVTIDKATIETNLAKGNKQPYGVVINCNGASSETNIFNTTFYNNSNFKDDIGNKYTTNGKDVIYMNGGTLNLKNVSFSGYGISNFINGQANAGANMNKINISGTENNFAMAMGRAIWNRGILTFAEGSYAKFSGGIEIENNNSNGAVVNFENGSLVEMKNGIVGTGTVNIKGGTLKGKITGSNVVNFNNGTWNLTGDSVVAGVVSDGDVTINGIDGNSLTVNNTITEKGKYAITHNSGTLTIKNLTIEDVIKEYNKQPANDNGIVRASVLYSNNSGKIVIEDSIIQDNSNTGDCKNYAVIDVTTNMDVKNTELKNNQSSYMGGALYLHNKEFNITDSEFVSNTASQGAAIQSNSATINFTGNTFEKNIATKANDGDCGGAICAQGAGVITFKGTNTFEGNKATGANGCGGAIAQYNNGTKIVFEKDSYTEFTNNTANGNGGAIWNGADAVIEVNGDLVFTGNTAGKKGNDIYNMSALKFLGGNTKVSGGIVSEGANAYVEISKDAVVELNGGTTSLNKLQGNGGVIHFSSADAQLAVVENTNETLKFTATSAVNEAVAGDANALVSEVDWAADTTMVMEAGDIVGEVTAELGENKDTGKLIVKSQTEAANPANQAISDAGIGLKLHYRYHMNDMNKRMGELRNANGEHGVWTRMVRGECEYENSKAQYNQYQLGYDEKLSVDKRWTVGAAVTFSEGDSSYGYGSTEDKSTAFAIYGSKLNNDGTFVDLIARYAHLESDIEDKAGKGDYSTNGMSVSAEFGKRIQQGNGLWIEPQFELTYGNFDSAEFQIGGKTVQVGDMDSLIGRIGFSLGKDIKQGNVYARASYLYDFDGETETAFSNASATRTFKDDLGGGWWEVGVGANINLSKATYIYADVEKAFGGEVDTNWQWNLGVRYSF